MIAFSLSLENLELFYMLVKELNADTEEKRVAILVAMSKMQLTKGVTVTNRTKEQYVKDMAQHFKVLNVVAKAPTEANANDPEPRA